MDRVKEYALKIKRERSSVSSRQVKEKARYWECPWGKNKVANVLIINVINAIEI